MDNEVVQGYYGVVRLANWNEHKIIDLSKYIIPGHYNFVYSYLTHQQKGCLNVFTHLITHKIGKGAKNNKIPFNETIIVIEALHILEEV